MGTSKKEMTFIFDTGSNQLWVPTTECNSCGSSILYDTSTSSGYRQLKSTTDRIEYGKGEVVGYRSEDYVYFTETQVVENMPLLAVFEEYDFEGTQADGILGLAPLDQQHQPQYLLTILRENGLISQRILSFILRLENERSVVLFGDPDYSLATTFSKNATLSIYDKGTLYFSLLYEASIGGSTFFSAQAPVLFDTGTSLLQMPRSGFLSLLDYYSNIGVPIQQEQGGGLYYAPCDQIPSYPLQLRIGDFIFSLNFSKFWSRVGVYSCFLFIQEGPFWILGNVFLRDYYLVMDYDVGQIRVYGPDIRHTDDPPPYPYPYSLNNSESYLAPGWIVLIVLGYAVVSICASLCIEARLRQTARGRNKHYQEPLEMSKR